MRRSMLARLAGLVGPVMLFACQLSAAAATATPTLTATASPPPSATATSSSSATPTLTPTRTATPTLTPTATTTFTPSPTSTQTPTPDPLAGVVLKLNDLPDGFIALSDADRARLHFSDADIQNGFGKAFSLAQPHNTTGFIYSKGTNVQVALTFLSYPLSALEQASMDASLSNPTSLKKAFGTQGTVQFLSNMNKFGDKSVGLNDLIATSDGQKSNLTFIIVRRGIVLEAYIYIYANGFKPVANLVAMVGTLDARVAAVIH